MPLHCNTIVDQFFLQFLDCIWICICICVFLYLCQNHWTDDGFSIIQWPHPPSEHLMCIWQPLLPVFLTESTAKKHIKLKKWCQTMITFLPPMLQPLHLLQPELQRKQCVKVHRCVSSDIRPGLERQLKPLGHHFESCKNQPRTLSFHIECISPQDPHR